MELTVVESTKSRMVFELPGADHTFCNALKEELWEDKDVSVATYIVKHPLIPVPKFILEAKDPKKALAAACTRLEKNYKAFATVLAKA